MIIGFAIDDIHSLGGTKPFIFSIELLVAEHNDRKNKILILMTLLIVIM